MPQPHHLFLPTGATPSSQQDPWPERAATRSPCRSRPGCSSLRSRRGKGGREEAGASGPSPEPRPPKPAVRDRADRDGRHWGETRERAPPGSTAEAGSPAGWPGARPPVPGWGVTGPAPSETLPAARPLPRTHQDPLEERVLLGREAHGRHGSGSSRGSRHRPARSVRLSARRRCRSQARFSLESSAPPPLGLGCRRVALS